MTPMKFLMVAGMVLFGMTAQAAPAYVTVDFNDDVTASQIASFESEYKVDVVPNSLMFSKTKITRLEVDESEVEAVIEKLSESDFIQNVEQEQTYHVGLYDADGWRASQRFLNDDEDGMCLGDSAEVDSLVYEENLGTDWLSPLNAGSPNDPLYREGKQWNMTMIGVEKAWATTKGKGVVVAVLDTGVSDGKGSKKRVPDLKETAFVPGYNFVNDNTDAYDGNAHGTHVAGTIAQSTNNGIGVVGIAYEAAIMPVKVLSDGGSGSTTDIAEAIIWATDNGANVINMSLGGGGHSKVFAEAVKYAADNNVFVACAAGNSGRGVIEYPAAYDGCQAVSSVGKAGKLAYYSSYGTNGDGVFIAAPGGDQQADGQEGGVWQNTIVPGDPSKHGFFPFQGTSMATPHVAGVAALVIATLGDDYELSDVKEILSETALERDDVARYGNGVLSAEAAVSAAQDKASGTNYLTLSLALLLGLVTATKFKSFFRK